MSKFLLGAAFGLGLGVLHAIASDPGDRDAYPYKMIETKGGLKCVVFHRFAGVGTTWGSCNWDEYNFKKWHSTPPPDHPPIRKQELLT